MYRMVIAEDESIIRNGILHALDWALLGFEIVGVAEDGLQALEMIPALAPHALITDIKMPGMTGLELLRAIRAAHSNIQVVIITGHAEFEYAREALQGRAFAYILKMDLLDELEGVARALRQALDTASSPDMPTPNAISDEMTSKLLAASGAMEDAAVGQALRYLSAHFMRLPRMEEVAHSVFLNPSYFSRLFKEKMGIGFSGYMLNLRMDWAKSLLKQTSLRVADVARTVGYQDAKYFTSLFRATYGVSPAAFRQKK